MVLAALSHCQEQRKQRRIHPVSVCFNFFISCFSESDWHGRLYICGFIFSPAMLSHACVGAYFE